MHIRRVETLHQYRLFPGGKEVVVTGDMGKPDQPLVTHLTAQEGAIRRAVPVLSGQTSLQVIEGEVLVSVKRQGDFSIPHHIVAGQVVSVDPCDECQLSFPATSKLQIVHDPRGS